VSTVLLTAKRPGHGRHRTSLPINLNAQVTDVEPFSTRLPLNAEQARQILEHVYVLSRESFRYGVACAAEYGESPNLARDSRDDAVHEVLHTLMCLMPTPDRDRLREVWRQVLESHLDS
jgi:hypothetical protein